MVLPLEDRDAGRKSEDGVRLHDHWWAVRVVASDHPSYKAGGYDLQVPESELRRGTLVTV